MAEFVSREWVSAFDRGGLSRRDRSGGTYQAYVPDPLVGRAFVLDGLTSADVADAEVAITRLDVESTSLANTEALSRLLLRAEAVASSRIEGLEVGARRLLRAQAAAQFDEPSSDVTATEVLASIDAMAAGVRSVSQGELITESALLDVHRRLLAGSRLAEHGGRYRDQQNWIGGSTYNPRSAVYVPPPAELVPALMRDLVEFSNADTLPAVAQAAIAHAQFETIHPFVDGNGRAGRVLIHQILRRRGLADRVIAPISLVLATRTRDYIDGLNGYRHVGEGDSGAAIAGVNEWVGRFAAACTKAVADARVFDARIVALIEDWRARLGSLRADSTASLLLPHLVGAPIVTAPTAATLTGRSFPSASAAIERLVEAGVLRQVSVGRRNRAYEAAEVFAVFTDLERCLANPDGNTRLPSRPVPR
ncbi:Fic family protein [Nocardia camponoti]|uniref:Fic family protein n=1 Tax=Nocardia camponoti TaxID=1616106 RepID=A0A917VEA3_9NOCA|nr:Fic family protein [Nocardia camponoti]GGK65736.1 Fic family protein [Nocardia camponoti]